MKSCATCAGEMLVLMVALALVRYQARKQAIQVLYCIILFRDFQFFFRISTRTTNAAGVAKTAVSLVKKASNKNKADNRRCFNLSVSE